MASCLLLAFIYRSVAIADKGGQFLHFRRLYAFDSFNKLEGTNAHTYRVGAECPVTMTGTMHRHWCPTGGASRPQQWSEVSPSWANIIAAPPPCIVP